MPDSALKRLAQMSNPGNWYIAALEGVQEYKGSPRMDPGWFHPSSLSEPCDANLAFSYLGAPATEFISANTRRVFDNGTGRDMWLKQDSKRAGVSLIQVEEERKIEIPELKIRGELDDYVQNPVTGKKYIVDFKTMRSSLWTPLKEIKPDHHIQIHPYMFGKGTPNGFVLYENKDTQELKSMEGNFDQRIWQVDIVDRIQSILSALDQGYVDRNPVSCSRCPFFANGTCAKNQIAKLKEESGLYDR